MLKIPVIKIFHPKRKNFRLNYFVEEGRRKKEEKMDGDSLRQATSCLQTLTNCQHRVDGEVLNPK
ncbi:hypothetical protein [Okeania sp. SIO2B3]|uniref:hypothetical protein n=1 Tax=Okeania sp. SIO2B3 TaxID=2607784 RepID=UPI0013BFF1FD|nr:hypothetical protein [Okeania sp. SIO2B3]NET41619.1 hypothetical protein [Okeania sp. SIO2B3]